MFDTLINQLSQTKLKTNETGQPLKTMRRKTGGILTRQSVTEKGVNCSVNNDVIQLSLITK